MTRFLPSTAGQSRDDPKISEYEKASGKAGVRRLLLLKGGRMSYSRNSIARMRWVIAALVAALILIALIALFGEGSVPLAG